jgi:hypothetical protein
MFIDFGFPFVQSGSLKKMTKKEERKFCDKMRLWLVTHPEFYQDDWDGREEMCMKCKYAAITRESCSLFSNPHRWYLIESKKIIVSKAIDIHEIAICAEIFIDGNKV